MEARMNNIQETIRDHAEKMLALVEMKKRIDRAEESDEEKIPASVSGTNVDGDPRENK